jgi:hemerythrin
MNFIWKEEYSVNVKQLDDQHKFFLGIMDKCYGAMQEKTEIRKIIGELIDYAELHFKTEEKYFDEFHYSEAPEHKRAHQELRDKIKLIISKDEIDPTQLALELLDFLEDWLVDHLANVDKKYSRCFNEHGLY